MKWETMTSTIGYSVYTLWNNGRKIVTLFFNPSSGAARIEYANEKRVFLIRKEGFLKTKTVLCNEYGIRIGRTGSEKNGDFIALDNERFFYAHENNKEQAVTIYKKSKDQPLAVCELSDQSPARNSLLMTLCWYLFQPVKDHTAAALYKI